jgi:predicted nucleic acid-binding protein
MARGARQIIQGSVVLDSQGLSLLLDEDERMSKRIAKAREESFQVVISAVTVLESPGAGPARRRRDFVLSRLQTEPLTRELALLAAELLHRTGMSGHQHAIDSAVAATALQQPRPVILYTSDPGDFAALCAEPDRPKDERVLVIHV